MREISAVVVVVFTLTILAGCTTHAPSHRPLAEQAVYFNQTVEEAHNEMLLLNVIRAKDRLPMYLTSVSSLNGNLSTSFSAGLGGSYSESASDTASSQAASGGALPATMTTLAESTAKGITRGLTPSLSGTRSRNPNFTLAVLDGEKFMRGFLSPIQLETFAFFWDQGWPRELLLYLLVQRVEVVREVDVDQKRTEISIFTNYPPKPEQFEPFAAWVTGFLSRDPRVTSRKIESDLGPPLERSEVATLSGLITTFKEGLRLKRTNEQWQLQRVEDEFGFTLEKSADSLPGTATERRYLRLAGPGQTGEAPVDPRQRAVLETEFTPEHFEAIDEQTREVRFLLRSPEAVLYYLGELTRVANRDQGGFVPHVCIQERSQPIFLAVPVSTGCSDSPAVVAETSRGEGYVIPAPRRDPDRNGCRAGSLELPPASYEKMCEAGRSMQALRFLSQLISLQKSAEDLPSPALVRVIGG